MKLGKQYLIPLFLLPLISMPVLADDSAPTVSDAHEFIRDLIATGVVRAGTLGHRFHNYRGSSCRSSMDLGTKGAATGIDWALITSVDNADNAVALKGTIFQTTIEGRRYSESVLNFNVPDKVTSGRLTKAMTLLMNSCLKKTKFD